MNIKMGRKVYSVGDAIVRKRAKGTFFVLRLFSDPSNGLSEYVKQLRDLIFTPTNIHSNVLSSSEGISATYLAPKILTGKKNQQVP